MYEYTQKDVRKIVEPSLRNVRSRVTQSQKSPHVTDEERCQGEIELDSSEREIKETKDNSGTE